MPFSPFRWLPPLAGHYFFCLIIISPAGHYYYCFTLSFRHCCRHRHYFVSSLAIITPFWLLNTLSLCHYIRQLIIIFAADTLSLRFRRRHAFVDADYFRFRHCEILPPLLIAAFSPLPPLRFSPRRPPRFRWCWIATITPLPDCQKKKKKGR